MHSLRVEKYIPIFLRYGFRHNNIMFNVLVCVIRANRITRPVPLIFIVQVKILNNAGNKLIITITNYIIYYSVHVYINCIII